MERKADSTRVQVGGCARAGSTWATKCIKGTLVCRAVATTREEQWTADNVLWCLSEQTPGGVVTIQDRVKGNGIR